MADIVKYSAAQVAGFPEAKSGRIYKASVTLDASEDTLNTSDTYLLMPIPAGALIKNVVANVKTAEGGTATVDIGSRVGSANVANQFHNNLNANSEAVTVSAASTEKMFTSSGYITMNCDNEMDAALITVTVLFVDANE